MQLNIFRPLEAPDPNEGGKNYAQKINLLYPNAISISLCFLLSHRTWDLVLYKRVDTDLIWYLGRPKKKKKLM